MWAKQGQLGILPRSPEEGGPGVGTDHYVLLPRIWQLRHNFSAYDAAYIVLAEKPALPWSRGTHDWLLPRAMRRPLSCFEPAAMGSSAITGVPHPLSRSSRKGWLTGAPMRLGERVSLHGSARDSFRDRFALDTAFALIEGHPARLPSRLARD